MQQYELPGLTNKNCLCPRCDEIGAAIAEDSRLGLIYECFECSIDFHVNGKPSSVSVKWAVFNGEKLEVIG